MNQTDIFGTKPLTKSRIVELMLIDNGWSGVTNIALNHITFRYGAVICELRKRGHIIKTGPTDKYGKVVYYYGGRK